MSKIKFGVWVDATKEYPPEGIVLICALSGSVTTKQNVFTRRFSKRDVERKTMVIGDWVSLTHWMRLPSPPVK